MAQGKKADIPYAELKELLKTYTILEIAKFYNVSVSTIRRYKEKYNLQVNRENARKRNSEKHTKWKYDIHYFDVIDTMDKAYLLGFLCADGFVTDHHEVGIAVNKRDIGIVEFFKQELKTNKPFYEKFYNDTSAIELRIQNTFLAEKLCGYGIVPRKSLVLNIEDVIQQAKLTDKQVSVFLLGYFDGDGCISIGHRSKDNKEYFEMNITGTLETITYFYKYFNNHGCLTKRHKDTKNNYTLSMSNNYKTIYEALKKIYQYCDELNFFFQRKHNKFKILETKVKS